MAELSEKELLMLDILTYVDLTAYIDEGETTVGELVKELSGWPPEKLARECAKISDRMVRE